MKKMQRMKWTEKNEIPWPLLLEADPDPEKVKKYFFESVCLVATDDGEVVAEIVFKQTGLATWEILNLCVAAKVRGCGVATELLAASFDWIKQHKETQTIKLMIRTGDISPARNLYEKVGFVVTEIHKNYFIQHYPEEIFENGRQLFHQVVMEKILD